MSVFAESNGKCKNMQPAKSIPASKWHQGIFCRKCRTIVCSWSTHDFVECKCKSVFVDGGFDYFRYGGYNANMVFVMVHVPKQKIIRKYKQLKGGHICP